MTGFDDLNIAGYRPGVGIVLFNRAGLVFAGRRIDTAGEAWQMPQGGLDPGETLQAAALRELGEEIGTANAEILERTEKPLVYDLPADLQGRVWGGRYRGQAQHWFAMRFLGSDSEIDLAADDPQEFDAWRWLPLEALPDLIVDFKRPLYERLVRRFQHLARSQAAS